MVPGLIAALLLAPACRAAPAGSAQASIDRAITAVGLSTVGSSVRTGPVASVISLANQSDRMYPPYLWTSNQSRSAMDWERGLLRTELGNAPNTFAYISDSSRRALVSSRGAQMIPLRFPSGTDDRAIDPWVVLSDWRGAANARVAEECMYRDYWRTVLTRTTSNGVERLFVDPKTGIPVKLERREPHYLWGDVLVEYLWSIWMPVKGSRAIAPQFAFRMIDGEVDEQRTASSYALQPRDSAGSFEIPNGAPTAPAAAYSESDTVRVSANTFLLTTRAYTNVVTLQRDTVFILDAQTSSDRAHGDSAWIGKLFPGRHPIVLVVTDLAWPHISGVRYWVANGATVISHPASRDFLTRVIERKWTLKPDLLEQRRSRAKFVFLPTRETTDLAGGAVKLRAIDGIGSEGALMAFIPGDNFLYAGDYIQNGGPGSFSAMYAREVSAAVRRAGFAPQRFAAMHVPLTDWTALPRFTGEAQP